MNLKTYTWVKFFATFGSILLIVDPLFIVLKVVKDSFFIPTWTGVVSLVVPIYLVGVAFLVFYFLVRWKLSQKSTYTYTKKDQLYLLCGLGLYLLAILVCGLDLIVGLISQSQIPLLTYTFFGVSYALLIVGVVGGAICESLSRVQEQIQLYQDQETKINHAKKAQRNQLLKGEISEEEVETEVKANRTESACKLLNQAKKQTKPKPDAGQVQPPIGQPADYNPFFDEKLKKELEADPQFKTWLENKKTKKSSADDEKENIKE